MGRLRDKFNRKYYTPQEPEEVEPEGVYDSEQYQPTEEELRQYHKQQVQQKQKKVEPQPKGLRRTPLSILDEIKDNPTPKGTFPVVIQGIPVDLHALEDYMLKISPYDMKTLQRFEKARLIEDIKNYGRFGTSAKLNMRTIFIILVAIGMAVLGIVFIMFMPKTLAFFQQGV